MTLILVTFLLRLAAKLVVLITDGCYQFLKALRRGAGSFKVVCKFSISHIACWVPEAFPTYDFNVVNTRSKDLV